VCTVLLWLQCERLVSSKRCATGLRHVFIDFVGVSDVLANQQRLVYKPAVLKKVVRRMAPSSNLYLYFYLLDFFLFFVFVLVFVLLFYYLFLLLYCLFLYCFILLLCNLSQEFPSGLIILFYLISLYETRIWINFTRLKKILFKQR